MLAWRRQTPALIERMNELTTQRGVFDFCSIFSTKCLSDCLQDLSHKYMTLSGGLTFLLCVERISPSLSTHTHTHTHPQKHTFTLPYPQSFPKDGCPFLCVKHYIQSHSKRMDFFNHYGKDRSLTTPALLLPLCHWQVPLNDVILF